MADPAEALGFGRTPPHEYGGAARSRPHTLPGRGVIMVSTALGALVVGFLITSFLSAGREAATIQEARQSELIALITERREHTEELTVELEQLRARVDVAQAEVAEEIPALQTSLREAELQVGLIALRGPGLRLTMSDASTACGPDCRIHDFDLQLAMNTLFGAGAEAMAVNGERVMATTSMRSAGQAVLVNGTDLYSPFEIEVIGDPDELRAALAASQLEADFRAWEEDYGLGFETEVAGDVEVPSYAGSLGVEVAEPAETGGGRP